jgi:hypothetical protein
MDKFVSWWNQYSESYHMTHARGIIEDFLIHPPLSHRLDYIYTIIICDEYKTRIFTIHNVWKFCHILFFFPDCSRIRFSILQISLF